jgi:hypothetical protein
MVQHIWETDEELTHPYDFVGSYKLHLHAIGQFRLWDNWDSTSSFGTGEVLRIRTPDGTSELPSTTSQRI